MRSARRPSGADFAHGAPIPRHRFILVLACAAVGADTLTACSATHAPAPATTCPGADALIAASDYTSSGVGAIALDGGGPPLAFGADLGTDPALAASGGHAFFVARDLDRVFALDACGRATQSFSVNDPAHAGTSNPQDVAVAPDGALWVPAYNAPEIAIVQGGSVSARIDISAYDSDGNPNASGIRIVDVRGAAKAFVPLEKLRWTGAKLLPAAASSMLRIDVATRAIEGETTLAGKNPFNAPGAIAEQDGVLYLAEPGDVSLATEADAGIERFDTATSTTAILVRESDIGGSVTEIAVAGRCGAALAIDPSAQNRVSLLTFDAETGAILARNIVGPSADFDTGARGLAWAQGGRVLLVGDRLRTANGYPVHAFDRDDACNVHERSDAVFVSQKPIAVRSPG